MTDKNQATPQSLYELLGGEPQATENIRDIVEAFYDVMDTDEKAKTIRLMHPDEHHQEKSFLCF